MIEQFSALLPEFVFVEDAEGKRMDSSVLQISGELHATERRQRREPDEEHDPTAYEAIGRMCLKVPDQHRVCMKTEGVFSEFCELIAQDITFKPPHPNVYEQ